MPLLRHLFERAPGGGLLRLLFRAAGAAADLAAVEQHGHGECLVMVRTALGADGIGKRLPGAALHALLQLGLIVLDVVDLPLGQTVEDVREDTALRGLQPAVKIHGGDDRLHRVGENGRPLSAAAALLPVAEADIVAQMQRERHAVQRLLADELGRRRLIFPSGMSG